MLAIKLEGSAALKAAIDNCLNSVDPTKFLPALEVKVYQEVTLQFRDYGAAHPNQLGGASTGFWDKAAASTESETIASPPSVQLTVKERGVALQYYGGVVVPSGRISEVTGKAIKRLAIPVIAAAHGKSPKEIGGLELGKFTNGFGLGKDGELWFRLVKKTTHKPHPDILPLDLEERLVKWFIARLARRKTKA